MLTFCLHGQILGLSEPYPRPVGDTTQTPGKTVATIHQFHKKNSAKPALNGRYLQLNIEQTATGDISHNIVFNNCLY